MSKFMTIYALVVTVIGICGTTMLYFKDFTTLHFYHEASDSVRLFYAMTFFIIVIYSFAGGCIALISGINAIAGKAAVITIYIVFTMGCLIFISPQHAMEFFVMCNSITGVYYVFVNLWKNNPYILWYDRIISLLIALIFGAVGVVVFSITTED